MAEAGPCRKGGGEVLLSREGKAVVARRLDTPGEAWQIPQGGIDGGESPRHAVLRELAEETGAAKAEIIAESATWFSYDLPHDLRDKVWSGRYRGQEQLWFALRFFGDDGDIDLEAGGDAEFSHWKWVPLEDLPRLTVPFKRRMYERIVAEFRHLAEPERQP